jgi:hypothetical protein
LGMSPDKKGGNILSNRSLCWCGVVLLQRTATSAQTRPADTCLNVRFWQPDTHMSLKQLLRWSTNCSRSTRHKRKHVPLIYFQNNIIRVKHGNSRFPSGELHASSLAVTLWACVRISDETRVLCEDLHGFP